MIVAMRARNNFFLFGLLLLLTGFDTRLANGQKAAPPRDPDSFESAEELVYEAEFSRALLRNVNIADFRFTATRKPFRPSEASDGLSESENAPYALLFTGEVVSKGFFSKLFNLRFREHVESTVEPATFAVQKTTRLDEQGKRVRSSETIYDRQAGQVVWTERDPNNPSRKPRVVSSPFTGQVHDVLSAIYFLRTLPLRIGKIFELSVSDSGQVFKVPLRVIEGKKVKTVLGRVEAVRVDAELSGVSGMSKTDQFSIWLTDDYRHVPVSARIKNEYGTFDIKLKKVIQNNGRKEYVTRKG